MVGLRSEVSRVKTELEAMTDERDKLQVKMAGVKIRMEWTLASSRTWQEKAERARRKFEEHKKQENRKRKIKNSQTQGKKLIQSLSPSLLSTSKPLETSTPIAARKYAVIPKRCLVSDSRFIASSVLDEILLNIKLKYGNVNSELEKMRKVYVSVRNIHAREHVSAI